MTDNTKPVIEVENLVTHYGKRKILDGVNMTMGEGEIRVIMGGSGSGKSTFLWHLLGLYKPTAGRIRLLGQDINQISARDMLQLRKQLGVSFQGGALFTSLSVGENVALPLREHTDLDENTIRIMSRLKLEVVNLGGFQDLMPSQLSGGMIKRAALDRAVVMDPKLLFFDEPSAGLDPVVAAELDDLILRLRDAMRMSMVVVTPKASGSSSERPPLWLCASISPGSSVLPVASTRSLALGAFASGPTATMRPSRTRHTAAS